MYVFTYDDQLSSGWKRKTDFIYDIIECMSDKAVKAWEKQYHGNMDTYHEEDEED
jgi:predicted translin family RNA/ssDNA-binding protein